METGKARHSFRGRRPDLSGRPDPGGPIASEGNLASFGREQRIDRGELGRERQKRFSQSFEIVDRRSSKRCEEKFTGFRFFVRGGIRRGRLRCSRDRLRGLFPWGSRPNGGA